jgi:hypothetical protein
MSKHGKNGREIKKIPIPKEKDKSKPQGLIESIIVNQKNGQGIPSVQPKKEIVPRVTKLYLMFSNPKKKTR